MKSNLMLKILKRCTSQIEKYSKVVDMENGEAIEELIDLIPSSDELLEELIDLVDEMEKEI
jgi:hypothetical protein